MVGQILGSSTHSLLSVHLHAVNGSNLLFLFVLGNHHLGLLAACLAVSLATRLHILIDPCESSLIQYSLEVIMQLTTCEKRRI